MKVINYTPAELKRVQDLMDNLIADGLLEELGYKTLKEIPQNEKQAFHTEHFKRMQAAGF